MLNSVFVLLYKCVYYNLFMKLGEVVMVIFIFIGNVGFLGFMMNFVFFVYLVVEFGVEVVGFNGRFVGGNGKGCFVFVLVMFWGNCGY